MSASIIDYTLDGEVAVLRFDDGKANAISHASVEALHAALDRAEGEARAMLLLGRPGRFSAGFDLGAFAAGPEAVHALVTEGAELLLRIYTARLPTVMACTGHALAAGAILLMVGDTRVGARGDFKIGLNEVAIGMALPGFGVELARDRLSRRHVLAATVQSRMYSPEDAVDVGFLDRVCEGDALEDEAMEEARALATLGTEPYFQTKLSSRGRIAEGIRATLADDIARLTGQA